MSEQPIGMVTHYFGKVSVAGVSMLAGELNVGDTIYITGHTTDFQQTIGSMQIEHEPVDSVHAGDQVGISVIDRVRVNDRVFRVLPD